MDWSGNDGSPTVRRYVEMAEHVRSLSPTYERLCLGIADDRDVIARLDTLPPPKRQPNLLLGAVRLLGGPIEDYREFSSYVVGQWDALAAVITSKRTQTNEARRTASLLPVLAALPQPLALLEVGASAGLCLYPDRYAFRYDDGPVIGDSSLVLTCATSGPVPVPTDTVSVAWRAGLDLNPLDLSDEEDVRWLQSLIWPEETERFAILRDAIEVARQDPAEVHVGDLTRDVVSLATTAPTDATLVVFHTAVLAYLDQAGRTAFRRQLAEIAASRTVVWISNEAPGIVVEVADARPNEFVLTRDGEPLGFAESHGGRLRWIDGRR